MKIKEITIKVEEYVFIPEEDLFTWKDLAELLLGTALLFIFTISFYVIFWPMG